MYVGQHALVCLNWDTIVIMHIKVTIISLLIMEALIIACYKHLQITKPK